MSGLVRFRVSAELLRQAMNMPKDCTIVGVKEQPFGWGTDVWFVVESPSFPKVLESCTIPEIVPVVITHHFVAGEVPPTTTWNESEWQWKLGEDND